MHPYYVMGPSPVLAAALQAELDMLTSSSS
jgi:hypothetical protein